MNIRPPGLWLVALALLAPGSVSAQFDEDEREEKADAKYTDGDGPNEREARAWAEFQKKLGPGPVYRVEVLAYESETNRFYLHQALLSSGVPRVNSMFGLGTGDFGQAIAPPDPGYARVRELQRVVSKGGKEVYPLAW